MPEFLCGEFTFPFKTLKAHIKIVQKFLFVSWIKTKQSQTKSYLTRNMCMLVSYYLKDSNSYHYLHIMTRATVIKHHVLMTEIKRNEDRSPWQSACIEFEIHSLICIFWCTKIYRKWRCMHTCYTVNMHRTCIALSMCPVLVTRSRQRIVGYQALSIFL